MYLGGFSSGARNRRAYPSFLPGSALGNAYLLHFNQDGKLSYKTGFSVDSTRLSSSSTPALVRTLNGKVIVAVNYGSLIRFNAQRLNVLGWPSTCFENASLQILEFDLNGIKLPNTRTVNQFQATVMKDSGNDLIVGGEMFDNCAQKGHAAVLKASSDGPISVSWKDDGIFPSAVRGLMAGDGLEIAVNFERAIGINVVKPIDPANIVYSKRYGDDNMAIREAAVIDLSRDGLVRGRQDFAAGLSIYLSGVTALGGTPIVYGSLGGEPASSLH
jgi:hypothetical protein